MVPAVGKAAPVDYVNPAIGTANDRGCGDMPFVEPPFAMTSWVAQTRENRVSQTSYVWDDHTISGFMGTHQPAVWMGDFGYVNVMPEVDAVKTTFAARKLPFSHSDEKLTPYYYSVTMDAGSSRSIRTEITATDHCGLFRITFPQNDTSRIVVEATRQNVTGSVSIDPYSQEIVGYNPDRMDADLGPNKLPNFKGYFVIEINKPFSSFGAYQGSSQMPGSATVTGENVGAYATFGTAQGESVEVRVGTSFISVDQARVNLRSEIPDWNFDAHVAALKNVWAKKLGTVSIDGASDEQLTEFYTCMYHSMLFPREMSEHGRYYSAFDEKIHKGTSYTCYSMWDIFRAENSFLTLFAPEREDGIVTALLNDYVEGGYMPKWPNPSYTNIMLGTHADSLVAEAIDKGFHGFRYPLAYQAVLKDAMVPSVGDTAHKWPDRERGTPYAAREGLTTLLKLGYVANDKTARAASATLEGAYDDYCVAQVAKAVGKTADYRYFIDRAQYYKHLFNPATGMINAKNSDGSWANGGDGFTEGGNTQNTLTVMQDIPGYISLMGGNDAFNQFLEKNPPDLTNEPMEHYPYLYDYSGAPWLTQQAARRGMAEYGSQPNGIPGNDDCGQLDAWWAFSALGFYPVNPPSCQYMIGSPLFGRIAIKLANGKTFTVVAQSNSDANVYIQAATLNGKALDLPFVTWQQIQAGGTLDFVMGPSPSKWASTWSPDPLPTYPDVTAPTVSGP